MLEIPILPDKDRLGPWIIPPPRALKFRAEATFEAAAPKLLLGKAGSLPGNEVNNTKTYEGRLNTSG